jgi:hypothetical protein
VIRCPVGHLSDDGVSLVIGQVLPLALWFLGFEHRHAGVYVAAHVFTPGSPFKQPLPHKLLVLAFVLICGHHQAPVFVDKFHAGSFLVSFLTARFTIDSVTPNLSAICRNESPCLRSTIALLASIGVAGRPAPILAPPCFVIRFSFKLEFDYTRIQESLQQVVPVYL